MNFKNLLILLAVGYGLWYLKNRPASKAEKIDWLNLNIGVSEKWVRLNEDELNLVYKVFRMVKEGMKPSEKDYLNFREITTRYEIKTT